MSVVDRSIDDQVRARALHRCEYCLMPQSESALRFSLDHIIARQHGGGMTAENLALACGRCNRHKGPNIAGVDPETGAVTVLFNPRRDAWKEHFRWDGARIMGLTPEGRATVAALALNHPERVAVRRALIEEGRITPR